MPSTQIISIHRSIQQVRRPIHNKERILLQKPRSRRSFPPLIALSVGREVEGHCEGDMKEGVLSVQSKSRKKQADNALVAESRARKRVEREKRKGDRISVCASSSVYEHTGNRMPASQCQGLSPTTLQARTRNPGCQQVNVSSLGMWRRKSDPDDRVPVT